MGRSTSKCLVNMDSVVQRLAQIRKLLEKHPSNLNRWGKGRSPATDKGAKTRAYLYEWVASRGFFGHGTFKEFADALKAGKVVTGTKSREQIADYLTLKHGPEVAKGFMMQNDVDEYSALRRVLPTHSNSQLAGILGTSKQELFFRSGSKLSYRNPSERQIFDARGHREQLQNMAVAIALRSGDSLPRLQSEIMRVTGLSWSENTISKIRSKHRKGGENIVRVPREKNNHSPLPRLEGEVKETYLQLIGKAKQMPQWRSPHVPGEMHSELQNDFRVAILRMAPKARKPGWSAYLNKTMDGVILQFNFNRMIIKFGLTPTEARVLQGALMRREKGVPIEEIAAKFKKPPEFVQGLLDRFDAEHDPAISEHARKIERHMD